MAQNSKLPAKSTFGLSSLFGPPPLLDGEDARAYDKLLARISSEMKPDKIEEIWIRDIADHTWEILRERRLKARLLSDEIPECLANILRPHISQSSGSGDSAWKLAEKWATGDPTAIERVGKLMASRKLSMDSVYAAAFMKKIDAIERIDHRIMILEGRRNAAFHEIHRHRAAFAQTLRGKVTEIEDAEFETIEPKQVASKITSNKNAA